jgi:hypothetical protein
MDTDPPSTPFRRETGRVARPPRCDDIQQGRKAIWRGDGQPRFAPERFTFHQRLVFARQDHLARLLFELDRPIERFDDLPSPCVGVQIVYQIAAAHDRHALFAQRGEALPDLVTGMACGAVVTVTPLSGRTNGQRC